MESWPKRMTLSLAGLLLAVCFFHLAASGAPLATVEVFWTDTAPVLDGNMTDACWQTAAVVTDFKPASPQSQPTEVRFAYDGLNLYVFWTLHEKALDQVAMGEPETAKDQFARQRDGKWVDAVELQLYPGRTDKNFLMFISSPRGARYDIASRGTWKDYDPDWQSIPGRGPGGWTLEQKIPFAELAQVGAGFATPAVGDQWRVQMYRKKFMPQEVSGWGAGEPPPPDCANVIFRGRKTGAPLPEISLQRPEFFYGTGSLDFTVRGTPPPLTGTYRVSGTGQEQPPATATLAQADGTLSLPLRLLEAGDYRVRFDLRHQSQVVYSGQEIFTLAPLADLFPKVTAQELTEAGQLLATNRCPAFAVVRRYLDEFSREQVEAMSLQKRLATLTAGECRRLAELHRLMTAHWTALRHDLNLARLYPGQAGAPTQLFGVGAATENDKLYPDTDYQGSLTEPIHLALAGNEYGSFQLAVIPFWTDLKDGAVSFTALAGPDGKEIAADNLCWFWIGYVSLEEPPAWLHLRYEHAREPDPLLPAMPFGVAPGTLAALWVDVRVPAGMPAGTYKGQVKVTASGQTITRPLEVECYGFDIPRKSSLANEFWFTPDNWQKFYGQSMKYTPELHARHAAVLGRYRVSSFPCDWTTLCPQVPIYAEADGHFTFDWTTYDQYVKNALDHGTTAFWSALSCNSGWTNYLHNAKTKVIERATGQTVELGRYIPPVENCWDLAKLPYRENQVYREFLQAYVTHLKELGINDMAYYELFDEAGGERFKEMLRHHRFFRETVPDLKLLDFGIYPTQAVDGQTAVGLMDSWAPHIEILNQPADLAALYERRAKFGEKLWAYTCIEFRRDAGGKIAYDSPHTADGYTPYCLYYRPYAALRIHAWMAWKYQLDGIYIFSLSSVPPENTGKTPAERWPNAEWSDGRERGCGTLVYPGPDFEMIPGMRLANLRDGLEDYEYFATLKALAAKLDKAKHADLLGRVAAALEMDHDIVGSVFDWTKDRARLEAKRRQLADLIKAVNDAR